jgi:hypothetical protein
LLGVSLDAAQIKCSSPHPFNSLFKVFEPNRGLFWRDLQHGDMGKTQSSEEFLSRSYDETVVQSKLV